LWRAMIGACERFRCHARLIADYCRFAQRRFLLPCSLQ
jgi:hypothetical protein